MEWVTLEVRGSQHTWACSPACLCEAASHWALSSVIPTPSVFQVILSANGSSSPLKFHRKPETQTKIIYGKRIKLITHAESFSRAILKTQGAGMMEKQVCHPSSVFAAFFGSLLSWLLVPHVSEISMRCVPLVWNGQKWLITRFVPFLLSLFLPSPTWLFFEKNWLLIPFELSQ